MESDIGTDFLDWALSYDGYQRLAASPDDLRQVIQGGRDSYSRDGVVPTWCGVDYLRGWIFYLARQDHHEGYGHLVTSGFDANKELIAVVGALRAHCAATARDVPPAATAPVWGAPADGVPTFGPDAEDAISPALVSAVEKALTWDSTQRLSQLARHMKVEAQFRDAMYLAMSDAGIVAQPEAYSGLRVARTDLVFTDASGRSRAVEFKYWLAPDVSIDLGHIAGKPSNGIRSSAARDWAKHNGDVTLVTVISRVRSSRYFRGRIWDDLWNNHWDRSFEHTLRDSVDARYSVCRENESFVVYVVA